MKFSVSFLGSVSLLLSLSLQAQTYKTDAQDTSCGGYPAVRIESFPNSCLGLIVDGNSKDPQSGESLRFPRKILELSEKRFLVTDMGGWSLKKGALWELDLRGAQPQIYKIVSGLNMPHDLEWGPDGHLYVGELGRIVRYSKNDLLQRKSPQSEVVINDLPTNLKNPNLHPLINFAFGKTSQDQWDLYINVGAPSDACLKDAPRKCGVEETQGVLRRYFYRSGVNQWDAKSEVWASGLRNSMGLVSHASGVILQAENSRDFKEDNEPFDELNLVEKSKHFGWPYCYNFQATSPEWKETLDCTKNFSSPLLLLPPHSAPLDLIYYQGEMFPELKNTLLMTWHGYRPTGSRIVAYPVDVRGVPVWKAADSWSYSNGKERALAKPQGGNLRAAEYLEVISSWWKRDGIRPAGSPVGMTVASDGAILIVEDKNKTILRLVRSTAKTKPDEDLAQEEIQKKEKVQLALKKLNGNSAVLESYEWINQYVFQKNCIGCHSQLKGAGTEAFEFMIGEGWIDPSNSLLNKRLRGIEGVQKMPLGSAELPKATVDYIELWLKAL